MIHSFGKSVELCEEVVKFYFHRSFETDKSFPANDSCDVMCEIKEQGFFIHLTLISFFKAVFICKNFFVGLWKQSFYG